MNNFQADFAALMQNEGGYSDDPHDPGGATNHGVTERVARAHGYQGDMRDLPLSVAYAIAKTEYADPYRYDDLPAEIAFQVLDAAYNGGPAAHWLQQACGAVADGKVGDATVAAAKAQDPDKVVMRFDAYRLQYLADLKNWTTFSRGWAKRIAADLLRAAGAP